MKTAYFSFLFLLIFAFESNGKLMEKIVAVVNDSIITKSELELEIKVYEDEIRKRKEKDSKTKKEKEEFILDRLVEKKLIRQSSDKLGINITKEDVEKSIDKIIKDNNMSKEDFLRALSMQSISYEDYFEKMEEDLRRYKFMNYQFTSRIVVTETDVNDYFLNNKNKFQGENFYNISVLYLAKSQKETFEENKKNLFTEIEAGETFENLVKKYSTGANAKEGGNLGFFSSKELSKIYHKAVKDLKINEISEPLEDEKGLLLVKLIGKKFETLESMDDIKMKIRGTIHNERLNKRYKTWLKKEREKSFVEIRLSEEEKK